MCVGLTKERETINANRAECEQRRRTSLAIVFNH